MWCLWPSPIPSAETSAFEMPAKYDCRTEDDLVLQVLWEKYMHVEERDLYYHLPRGKGNIRMVLFCTHLVSELLSAAGDPGHGCCCFRTAIGNGGVRHLQERRFCNVHCVWSTGWTWAQAHPHIICTSHYCCSAVGGVFLRTLYTQQGGWLSWAAVSAGSPYFSLFIYILVQKPPRQN